MTRSKCIRAALIVCLGIASCGGSNSKNAGDHFDDLSRTVDVNNWQFVLNVENQNKKKGIASSEVKGQHYLKATLNLSNSKTKKSLLYSVADDINDYEEKYKYLSFGSKDDLYLKCGEDYIYPIGYVFEPSNGLNSSERLVYKFQLPDDVYEKLRKNEDAVEYWYVDNLLGVEKICFKQQ